MIKSLVIFALSLVSINAWSQHPELQSVAGGGSSSIEKARTQYDLGSYSTANTLFFDALDNNQFDNYDFLLFANSLMAENKTSLAREFFNEYLRLSGKNYGETNDLASAIFRPDTNLIPASTLVHGTSHVYSPTLYDGKLYGSINGSIHSMDYSCAGEITRYKSQQQMGYRSSVTYFNQGFSAVFTVTDTIAKSCNLFLLEYSREGWSKPKKPLFNEVPGNYASPYFDTYNNILYFSSDRSGGQGGYDIYMSYYVKGKFQRPINLGNVINTPRHEIGTFSTGKWLYFSSNGHPSKGGFDLYKYAKLDDFTHILRNERKFNTNVDEYGLVQLAQDNFMLNRFNDSLSFLVHYSSPQPLNSYRGVVETEQGAPLAQAIVLIQDEIEGRYVKTNNSGEFSFELDKKYPSASVSVHLESYRSNNYKLESNELMHLAMYPNETVDVVKVVNNAANEDSQIILAPSREDSTARTEPIYDPLVRGVSKPQVGTYYVIVASARSYNNAYASWSKWVEEFSQLEIVKFNENLYRIGFKTGLKESDAIAALRETIKLKNDAWIIRPGTF